MPFSFIKNKPAVSFALAHILSYVFFSNLGVSIDSKTLIDSKHFEKPLLNPLIALYPNISNYIKNNKYIKDNCPGLSPCVFTTGYSIKLLTKTAICLKKSCEYDKSSKSLSGFIDSLINLAIIQMEYCMEKLKFKKYPKMNILPLLEGGIEILTIVRSGDFTISTFSPGLDCLMTWLDILHKEITKDLYPQSLTSQDISKTLYALIYRKRVLNYDCEEHISNLALELLHRKNEFGLISKDGVGKRTACMSSQFLAVDALLESYFYCNIDYIYEEALSLFNTIFDIGWNDSLDVFSFNPSQSIVYSSSDIAAVVKCLYHISQWTKNDMRKNKILSIIDTSYLNPIYNNFTDKWEKKIKRMYHIYSITKNPCNHDSSKFNKCTVYRPLYLPDKMVVKYPIHCISWEFSRVLRIWQQFYLCCILLDIHIEEFKTNSTANNDEVDESQIIMDIIKLLFNN